jgi:hypothetical protein
MSLISAGSISLDSTFKTGPEDSFDGFFHHMQECLQIGRKDSIKSRLPKNEEIR